MNKNQITMAAIGGIALVAVGVVGYLTYAAWAEKAEKAEDLESAIANARRINAAAIAPKQESVDAIAANAQKLEEWRAEMLALVSAGDFAVDPGATPESFKQKMVVEAREFAKLPGGVNGCIVKEEFDFGFKDYIVGGSMPPRDQLAALQRQWSEVGMVTVGAAAAEPPKEEEAPKRGKAKKGAQKKEAEPRPLAVPQSYELKFTAKPAAFVRTIDACAMVERFIVVDGFSFVKERDTLAEVFGGKDKAEAAAGGGRRGRRGRRGAAEVEQPAPEGAEEVSRKGLVTDPELDAPLTVVLKVTTFDFGTAAAEPKEATDEKEVAE